MKIRLLIALCLLLNATVMYAAVGAGGVADNIMQPVSLFSDFIQSACLVIGGSFVFASLVKYFEHRRSPLMVPISTVVFLLIAGLVLLALPLLAFFMENGMEHSLFRRR
ncbi:MAG TPA: hypothetical protein VHZ76_09165 [Gammaproteobacteria bacterium]|jgi:hypothetical protein|nr:hypothetical protein [Gammaproteobacteria bacterium]